MLFPSPPYSFLHYFRGLRVSPCIDR
jgi:hypothetical protein